MTYVIIILNMDQIIFGKLGIRDYRDEPFFPSKLKLLSIKIKINILFKNISGRKQLDVIKLYTRLC